MDTALYWNNTDTTYRLVFCILTNSLNGQTYLNGKLTSL